MLRHLLSNGVKVPAGIAQSVSEMEHALAQGGRIDLAALATAHERLARLVAPARPGTIYIMDRVYHRPGRLGAFGTLDLVRQMVTVAIVCVVGFIGLSILHVATGETSAAGGGGSFLATTPALAGIVEMLFWLSAAGIGAAFAMLFQINDYVARRTFDPDYATSYWIKFFLGMVAGFILVALVPINLDNNQVDTFAEPTVALLGGFSAQAVYRILNRLVETLENLIGGGGKEQSEAAAQLAQSQSQQDTAQAKLNMAAQLVDLQQRIAGGASTDAVSEQLRQIVAGLAPAPDADVPAAEAVAPPAEKVAVPMIVSAPEAVADAAPAQNGAPASEAAEETAAVG